MTPKKILILAANPLETAHLRLDKEIDEIDEGLRCSKWRDRLSYGLYYRIIQIQR